MKLLIPELFGNISDLFTGENHVTKSPPTRLYPYVFCFRREASVSRQDNSPSRRCTLSVPNTSGCRNTYGPHITLNLASVRMPLSEFANNLESMILKTTIHLPRRHRDT